MGPRTSRIYKGQTIRVCERVKGEHSGRWSVQGYHTGTNLPLSDELCSHYQTIAEARAAINGVAALEDYYRKVAGGAL